MINKYLLYFLVILLGLFMYTRCIYASEVETIDVPGNYIENTHFSLSGLQDIGYSVTAVLQQGSRTQYTLFTTKNNNCSAIIGTNTQSRKMSDKEGNAILGFPTQGNNEKKVYGWSMGMDNSNLIEIFLRSNVQVKSYGNGKCRKQIRGLLKKIKLKKYESYEPIPLHSLVKVKVNYDQKRYVFHTSFDGIIVSDTRNKLFGMVTKDDLFLQDTRRVENLLIENGLVGNIIEYNSLSFDGLNMRYMVMKVNFGGKNIFLTTYLLPDKYGRVIMIKSERNNALQNLSDIMQPMEIKFHNIGVDLPLQ